MKYYTANPETGVLEFRDSETVTERCGIKLTKEGRILKMCNSCHDKWESPDNRFATEEEVKNASTST